MTILEGKIGSVMVKEGDKLVFVLSGLVESGTPTLLDDVMLSAVIKKQGLIRAELDGLDLLFPGKEAWVVAGLTLKQPKDSTSSKPDVKARVTVECTEKEDFIPLVKQIISMIGNVVSLKLEWREV